MSELKDLLADLTSGNEERAECAVLGLVSLGEDAIPALRELMNSDEVDHRWWALRTLSQLPQVLSKWLLPYIRDEAVEVRQAAALGLSSHPDEESISPLILALNDPDSLVSSLVANALVAIGKAAVPALLDINPDAPMAVRVNAIKVLAEIQDHRAIPALMAALETDSALMQYWAEEGLERLGLNMVYMKPE